MSCSKSCDKSTNFSVEEKKKFFDTVSEKFVNTLKAHFDVERSEYIFFFDADIVDKLIGDMFFDLEDEEECGTKQKALSIFQKPQA